jgi:uncharacterized membrane protein
MAVRIIGVTLAVLGLIVNFAYKIILQNIFRVENITNKNIIRVKSAGLVLAVIGALIVFIFG